MRARHSIESALAVSLIAVSGCGGEQQASEPQEVEPSVYCSTARPNDCSTLDELCSPERLAEAQRWLEKHYGGSAERYYRERPQEGAAGNLLPGDFCSLKGRD